MASQVLATCGLWAPHKRMPRAHRSTCACACDLANSTALAASQQPACEAGGHARVARWMAAAMRRRAGQIKSGQGQPLGHRSERSSGFTDSPTRRECRGRSDGVAEQHVRPGSNGAHDDRCGPHHGLAEQHGGRNPSANGHGSAAMEPWEHANVVGDACSVRWRVYYAPSYDLLAAAVLSRAGRGASASEN